MNSSYQSKSAPIINDRSCVIDIEIFEERNHSNTSINSDCYYVFTHGFNKNVDSLVYNNPW